MIAHEATLLPRHWDWLAAQPGGASVTLRKLVEDACHAAEGANRRREVQEAAHRFMPAMAGNAAHFEDTARASFAVGTTAFESSTRSWPVDVRDFACKLASWAFQPQQEAA